MLFYALRPGRVQLVVLLIGVSGGLTSVVPAQTPEAPNIIVVLTDDQGWTGTSVQMDPAIADSKSDFYQTPNLERLAAEGMVFSSAYAPAAACSPTRASIITGKSPAQLQFTDIHTGGDVTTPWYYEGYTGWSLTPPAIYPGLPESETTIAEYLKELNSEYATANLGKWHLNYSTDTTVGTESSQGYDLWGLGDPYLEEDARGVERVTNAAIGFIEDQAALENPFYMQVNYYAPHAPIEAKAATIEKYENLTPGVRHDVPEYAAMIEDLDTAFGRLLDAISNLGLDDNTYIFFASDNGARTAETYTNNLPLTDGKGSIYEGGIRIPMIVKGPGIEAGSYSDVPVSLYDYVPTIASLVNSTIPLPDGVEGGDLTPLLFNEGALPEGMDAIERAYGPNGELYWHIPHYLNGGEGAMNGVSPVSAVRSGDYKLIKVYGHDNVADTYLLFNLAANIEESNNPNSPLNLAREMPEKVAELRAKLEAWLIAADASLPYDVADNIELIWNAGAPGQTSGAWRSLVDVDEYFREHWMSGTGVNAPAFVATTGQPAGLASQALRFDGDDVMSHTFFRVSDPQKPDVFDADHSASFEFWLRLDDLNSEQVLLESGDETSGLSITLGDGDADGLCDDIRFRILGADGNYLSLTAPINDHADPITEFIQLAAVFSDDPGDRYIEIYMNGQLQARLDGELGLAEIDWDGFDEAGLGNIGGDGLGANGGLGDLPFVGGGLRGEIALLRYNNYAIEAAELLARYQSIISPIAGDHDGDGFVGIDDLDIVLGNWNKIVTANDLLHGDFSGDGFVGLDDLDIILSNWNAGSAPVWKHSIPEPTTVAMFMLGLVCIRRR